MFLLIFGGMTGIAVATVSLDVHWHDTYFVVAHFHFIMVGSVMTMFLAALHYWWPKMFGRMYNEHLGLLSAALVFMGFVFTFLPQFLLGNYGMPRRYYHYPARYQWLHILSTAGATLLLFGLMITLGYLLASLKWGKVAPRNPWRSKGFEWFSLTPPPTHNYEVQPRIYVHPHDYAHGVPPVDEEPEGITRD
jgi:cytochrome c oxidase subunit 1